MKNEAVWGLGWPPWAKGSQPHDREGNRNDFSVKQYDEELKQISNLPKIQWLNSTLNGNHSNLIMNLTSSFHTPPDGRIHYFNSKANEQSMVHAIRHLVQHTPKTINKTNESTTQDTTVSSHHRANNEPQMNWEHTLKHPVLSNSNLIHQTIHFSFR